MGARHDIMTYLASEHAPVESQVAGNINYLDVGGHLLPHNQVDNVSRDERSSREARLHSITEDDDVGGQHTLDRSHNTRGRKVLPRIKSRLKDDDDEKNYCEGKVRRLWVRIPQRLPKIQK